MHRRKPNNMRLYRECKYYNADSYDNLKVIVYGIMIKYI